MVVEFYQDDPKKCTASKLRRLHLAVNLPRVRNIPGSSIVLNPWSSITFSVEDRPAISQHGLVALDCSWNLSDRVFRRGFPGESRRLPTLLASNPTNYGVPGVLSTVEALAAALYITGFRPEARKILHVFKWGDTFFSLNHDPLEEYAESSSKEMAVIEREYFGLTTGKPLYEI